MADLSPRLLPILKAHRLPELDLPLEFIHPKYDGGSILNLPGTLCGLMGVPPVGHHPALVEDILDPLMDMAHDIRRVVFILMDALAFHRLQAWMGNGEAPLWARLSQEGLLAPLTSVSPSTTSTALPTLWSGLSPAEHGMVGYELWLKEFGVVANMITHSPFRVRGDLADGGFKAEQALPGETLGARFRAHGVEAVAFQHYTIAQSGLSRMFLKDATVRPFGTAVDLMVNMRQLVEANPQKRQFIALYWSQVDNFSHNYGPDDERPALEFQHFSQAFEHYFLRRLDPAARKGTMVILAADHGQILTPVDSHYDLGSHPGLARRLHLLPTGENRMVYLHIRPGQVEAVREYVEKHFMGQFVQLDPGYAIRQGLFGPGDPHPRLTDRVGDLLLLPKGPAYLWWGEEISPIIGRHGGLTGEEMLVPLVAARL